MANGGLEVLIEHALSHQQKGILLAMPYRISILQMPYYINSKYIQGD